MTVIEERDGDRVRRGRKFTYTPSWLNAADCPDSTKFSDKAKVNIKPNTVSETFYCAQLNCGKNFALEPRMVIESAKL